MLAKPRDFTALLAVSVLRSLSCCERCCSDDRRERWDASQRQEPSIDTEEGQRKSCLGKKFF
jgi:hypothetical protein